MQNLLWTFVGATLGTAASVLPGIGPAVTVALLQSVITKIDPSGTLTLKALSISQDNWTIFLQQPLLATLLRLRLLLWLAYGYGANWARSTPVPDSAIEVTIANAVGLALAYVGRLPNTTRYDPTPINSARRFLSEQICGKVRQSVWDVCRAVTLMPRVRQMSRQRPHFQQVFLLSIHRAC